MPGWVIRHATQRGVSAARNSGIREARGTWTAFLDDDDAWAPDKLVSQLSAATAAGRGWVYTGDVHVDERLRLLGGGPPLSPTTPWPCCPPTTRCRRAPPT